MRFFDRTEEIASLRKIREMAQDNAQFTVVTGRRRIGKTSLVWKAYEDEPILYFFVARKAEGDLCEDYRLEIEHKLGVPTMGRAEHFTDCLLYTSIFGKVVQVKKGVTIDRDKTSINLNENMDNLVPASTKRFRDIVICTVLQSF